LIRTIKIKKVVEIESTIKLTKRLFYLGVISFLLAKLLELIQTSKEFL